MIDWSKLPDELGIDMGVEDIDDMVPTFVLEEGQFKPQWWLDLNHSGEFPYIPRHGDRKGFYQYQGKKVPIGSTISRAPDGTIHIKPEE